MFKPLFAASALALVATGAHAHVTLENQQATIGSTYKAVLRVPHGCEGSPTIAIRVQIPNGVIGIKPMPKPGWTLETVVDKDTKLSGEHGAAPAVKEVKWSGGKLLDAHYDEFVLRGTLSEALTPGMLYFPVVQECEKGVDRWIEIPADGKSAGDYKKPAPGLRLLPKP
jgi:periplasmic copper chaperone A